MTCFTSTHVQILTPSARSCSRASGDAYFFFLRRTASGAAVTLKSVLAVLVHKYTFLAPLVKKVQILTPEELRQSKWGGGDAGWFGGVGSGGGALAGEADKDKEAVNLLPGVIQQMCRYQTVYIHVHIHVYE